MNVRKSGEETAVAYFDGAALGALCTEENRYSSIDGAGLPCFIWAKGVTLDALLNGLGLSSEDLEGLILCSSDNWTKEFSGADVFSERYCYPDIVSGYDADADTPPEFELGADEDRQTVPAMLAVQSLESRGELTSPALSGSDGIRFCFGQEKITDAVLLDYGKNITAVTFVLKEDCGYSPAAVAVPEPSQNVEGEEEEYENEGLTADALTVTVGYYGGTYYTKKVFSPDELESMEQVTQVYSYIDNMPAVCLDSARGVRLTDVLKAAGIDANSVDGFHFYCADVANTWYTSFTRSFLLDELRYYYPKLPQCWDYDEAAPLPGASDGAVEVDTIIALEDNWRRFATAADFDNMTAETRFRLVFGQTDTSTPTSSRSAKWVHTIAVTLRGTAPAGIRLDASALSLEVGSRVQLNATLDISDNTTDQRVLWRSDNEDAVTVDSSGRITVLTGGAAVITATTAVGGLTASVVINGEPEPAAASAETEAALAPTPEPSPQQTQTEQPAQTGQAAVRPDGASADGHMTAASPPTPEAASDASNMTEVRQADEDGPAYEEPAAAISPALPEAQGASSAQTGLSYVQTNRKVYEMSETAIEFADVGAENNGLRWLAAALFAGLFLAGIAAQAVMFLIQIKDREG